MPKLFRFFILLPVLLCTSQSYGQKLDSIADNLHHYGKHHIKSTLFVHFDKNVYTNNDQVWFTGYLLKGVTDLANYHTLYISLVNNLDSTVVLQDKFLIEKGICFGNLTLPDSITGGNYRFVINANVIVNGKSDVEFIQPITIKSTIVNKLTATVAIFNRNQENNKTGTALLKVLTSDNRFVENAEINYTIGRSEILKRGTAKSSVIGELMIDYPSAAITAENNLLSITVNKGNDTRYINYDLPYTNQQQYQVRFFPEGGYLVNGITSRVGFEIKGLNDASIKARALLFRDNEVLDTISTNSHGFGFFNLYPNLKSKYYIKILSGDGSGQTILLPEILRTGITLSATESICDNILRIHLKSNLDAKVHLVLHNYSGIFLHTNLMLKANMSQPVKFQLDSVPAGLNSITVLDSLYRPLAEKAIFAHHDQISKINIETDKEIYSTRDSVHLELDLQSQLPWKSGFVSIACVQANRLTLINERNIVDYYLLEKELGVLPSNLSGIRFSDRAFLNELLMIKGWTRYRWPVEKLEYRDSISSMELTGQVKKGKKNLKVPVSLFTIAANNVNVFKTDNAGYFTIPVEYLLAKDKGKVWLNLQEKNSSGYDLSFNDPLNRIKKELRLQGYKMDSSQMISINDLNDSQSHTGDIKLKEVIITANRNNGLSHQHANECGDYVCQYNILNCPNHPGDSGNRAPVKGRTYGNGGRGGNIVYIGCTGYEPKPNVYVLNGVKLPKEFYISDVTNKNEPINFATVYWNYQTPLTADKPTVIKFNTGDLTGKFKVVVQGVADNGLIYGEKIITVQRK
ncbi:hypothetical protein [Pedobacter sp. BMA]|uniref:hypothetical protein n=1 Tax=Pedobacter sp. BMA TaxID=1663685 RepID=UPI000649F1FA|nr:hypothetical protein [Pedobacter sp. BMA]KLT63653.1 hypothetical protein AB669_20555 [Pedobacter sp. BMA]